MSKPLCRNEPVCLLHKNPQVPNDKGEISMLPMQRREKIKAILREQKSVTVLELMEYFNVTNETIRRDLLALEEEGFVSRVHGGAYLSLIHI